MRAPKVSALRVFASNSLARGTCLGLVPRGDEPVAQRDDIPLGGVEALTGHYRIFSEPVEFGEGYRASSAPYGGFQNFLDSP